MATGSVLSLDTLDTSATVNINGVAYTLSAPDSLSVMHYRRLSLLIPRIEALFAIDTPTDEQGLELEESFNKLSRIVLDAPPAVLDKLTSLQHVLIYQAFLKLPHETLIRVGALRRQGRMAPPDQAASTPSRGGKSARGSHGSTTARPATGIPQSQSPSSEPAS